VQLLSSRCVVQPVDELTPAPSLEKIGGEKPLLFVREGGWGMSSKKLSMGIVCQYGYVQFATP
jgi:hypothetical protein